GHASCRSGTVCLHWGLLRGDAYLDPLSLLLDQQVRLLPLGATATPVAPVTHPAAAAGSSRRLGAVTAAGSLALGLTLLAGRRRPAPMPPPTPVDLRAERLRRRAA